MLSMTQYLSGGRVYHVVDYSTRHKMLVVTIDKNGNTEKIEIYLTPYYGVVKTSLEFFGVEI